MDMMQPLGVYLEAVELEKKYYTTTTGGLNTLQGSL